MASEHRDANIQFRQTNPVRDIQWALLAFWLFVAVDIVALRYLPQAVM